MDTPFDRPEPRAPLTTTRELALAITGPAAAGAAIGFADGTRGLLSLGVHVPAVLFGTAALTLPALWVAASVAGFGPRLGAFGRSALTALSETGTALLGFTPALLFLSATASRSEPCDPALLESGLALAAIALAVLFGVRGLVLRFRSGSFPPVRGHLLTLGWALVSGLVGLHLLLG